jgi:hypothetical protein
VLRSCGDGGWEVYRLPIAGMQIVSHSHLLLDLRRAEVRDRVARWLAGRVGLEVGSTAPEFQTDEDGWSLFTQHHANPGLAVWDLEGRGAGAARSTIPALALLDPADSTTLPDGSRLVDALALGAVALHVGREVTP